MSSRKAKILAWLDRQQLSQEFTYLVEHLIQGAQLCLGMPYENAVSFADANTHRYWNYLAKKLDGDNRRGLTPLLHMADQLSYRLQWLPAANVRSTKRRKRVFASRIVARPMILEMIDSLTDREYEGLCCKVSEFAGAVEWHLTPPGNEGGVDFFALIENPGGCHLFAGSTGPIRIVGQSKKYGEKIKKGEIRDFVTSINAVRWRGADVEKHVPSWFRSAHGPIAGWLVAHSGVQDGAEQFARDHGIVISNSLDAAEIAAKSKLLLPLGSPAERAGALAKVVRAIIQGAKTAVVA